MFNMIRNCSSVFDILPSVAYDRWKRYRKLLRFSNLKENSYLSIVYGLDQQIAKRLYMLLVVGDGCNEF